MWAPKDKLTQSNDFYAKRHIEATGMKDDVLVVAWIGSPADGTAGDWSASQKLLAAVLAVGRPRQNSWGPASRNPPARRPTKPKP
jgi:hypothetical protein